MSKKHIVIPVFIPHKGCPFDCIYCNQKVISGQTEEMTVEKMDEIICSHLSTAREDSYIEIGFFGGSFTGIEVEKQIMFLESANKYILQSKIKGIRLSTRPDYIDSEILHRLKEYNVNIIELGVQSLDEDVLRKSGRGHGTEEVYKACSLIKENGIGLGIQTMIGLPGSNFDKDLDTAQKVVEIKPQIVRIYPTLVVRNTYLEKMYCDGSYTPLDLEEAVNLSAKLLELYNKNGIKVIRIGLQPTDNINDNFDVVGGPFHPSFRQLVESRLWLYRIENYIKEYSLFKEHDIIIYADSKNLCDIIGQRRGNIEYLKNKYQFRKISIKSIEDHKDEFFIRGL
ncbi:MAG TPA: radical SAM protein [Pseudobacteroides sp.]|nr:radical SAM protein [Pseudobacteroides sp.]